MSIVIYRKFLMIPKYPARSPGLKPLVPLNSLRGTNTELPPSSRLYEQGVVVDLVKSPKLWKNRSARPHQCSDRPKFIPSEALTSLSDQP